MGSGRDPVLLRHVRAFVKNAALPPGSHVLVAASGGPDSTALAAALGELAPAYGLRLTLAHVRHGFRSDADEAVDEAVVHGLAERLGTTPHVVRLDLPHRANVEARARTARRRALARLAAEIGASHIALGHTLDDQAETVLLQLLRGGGRGALGAMRSRAGTLLRPLLAATRADVTRYLSDRGLVAACDRSNADLRFTRNRVRRLLLPLLVAEFHPRIGAALARLAMRLRDEDDVLGAEAERHVRALTHGETLDCSVRALPPALGRRVVHAWLRACGVRAGTADHVERVLAMARSSRRPVVALPGPSRVVREGAYLAWRPGRAPQPAATSPVDLAPGVTVRGDGWCLAVSAPRVWSPGASAACPGDVALLDADALPGPLAVRSPRRGDRIQVVHVGTRKLHDVLIDRKVPRERRATLAVVVAAEQVLWIPGIVRSAVARVGEGTKRVLEARFVTADNVALPLTKPCGTVPGHGGRA